MSTAYQNYSVADIADDLRWDLSSIQKQDEARQFIQRFENKLCVFSPTVNQLYSDYSIYLPEQDSRSIVVLPNPYAFHDTFHRIATTAVRPTGIHIIPGEQIGRVGLYMIVKPKKEGDSLIPIPFKDGLRQILRRSTGANPFLPILQKGDLREFDRKTPALHLHAIKLSALDNVSALVRKGIKDSISEKMIQLYRAE